ncbi:MAG: type IV pilin N-terminal domain-containing protein [Methanospirillum sp.]|uniref:type IV pilin N-terminal domain-containing protein n=1 Tax=Methanospirillum sp. TaxID=45200 RepID=UPI00236F9437|nr:type IV pilin N-terminal domain-containing protein [Methanospirillum sp.]MDD1728588.1 type IV pilin N-terminal domain-containing protein [Methanospirillum sp.]
MLSPQIDPPGNARNKGSDPGVSPVVGIMLMLIVTVILAAVISGYAGGLSETKSKPPQLVLQTDAWKYNESLLNLSMTVVSTGEGIPTRDLKIITTWKTKDSSGGNTTIPGSIFPLGLVPNNAGVNQHDFGNYTLLGGTKMIVNNASGDKTIFGIDNVENIKPGDLLTIKFVHIPSQATIYNKELIVGGDSSS